VISYEPQMTGWWCASSTPITWPAWFPQHRFARRRSVSIADLGAESFIRSQRDVALQGVVLRQFERLKVPLRQDVEIAHGGGHQQDGPAQPGGGFLARMCVEEEIAQGTLREVHVTDLQTERKIRLVYSRRADPQSRRPGVPRSALTSHRPPRVAACPPRRRVPAPGRVCGGQCPDARRLFLVAATFSQDEPDVALLQLRQGRAIIEDSARLPGEPP